LHQGKPNIFHVALNFSATAVISLPLPVFHTEDVLWCWVGTCKSCTNPWKSAWQIWLFSFAFTCQKIFPHPPSLPSAMPNL